MLMSFGVDALSFLWTGIFHWRKKIQVWNEITKCSSFCVWAILL